MTASCLRSSDGLSSCLCLVPSEQSICSMSGLLMPELAKWNVASKRSGLII